MSDPIGTVRQASASEGYVIWVRMDPGYPDNQLDGTEWTCIWSTDEGIIGCRASTISIERARYPVIGRVPGTPAAQEDS